jgi:hypothetical protein
VEERIDAGYLLRYRKQGVIFKLMGSRELSMKSYDVQDHGVSDQVAGQAKKPWVTPSLEIIALESAESGTHRSLVDGNGGNYQRRFS